MCPQIAGQKTVEKTPYDSEERVRAMLEGSSDMIQVMDEQGTLKYVSPSMKRILGYDPAMPVGDSAFKIIHPEDMPEVQKKFREMIDNPGKPVMVVCRCRHADGTWRHMETWARNNLDNPAIRGIVLNIRDITDRVRGQAMLAESEEKFRSIVEQSHDGITIIDNTGTIILFNPAQERISGIPAAEALGKKIWDIQYRLITEAMRRKFSYRQLKQNHQQLLKTGKSPWLQSVINTEMVRADGALVHLETVVFPLRLATGTAYASFNRDITVLRKAEVALKEREAELSEQNRLLEEKNIALREVMGQLEAEKKKIGDQVQNNVDRLVMPLITKLKARCGDAERTYLRMLEENLRDISGGFGRGMSQTMYRFTQREIELCDMVRQGLSSKEIAQLRNISPRTVDTHRNRIRKKLGITDPEINLTTYLKSQMMSN